MRVLTVQQPWAWAIFHGKDVENRSQLWKYRGPLAIHAGARVSDRGRKSVLIEDALTEAILNNAPSGQRKPATDVLGAILGVVDLVDTHVAAPDCCDSPWGEHSNHHADKIVHLVLENARELSDPITGVAGALGLWKPTPDLLARIEAAA